MLAGVGFWVYLTLSSLGLVVLCRVVLVSVAFGNLVLFFYGCLYVGFWCGVKPDLWIWDLLAGFSVWLVLDAVRFVWLDLFVGADDGAPSWVLGLV